MNSLSQLNDMALYNNMLVQLLYTVLYRRF